MICLEGGGNYGAYPAFSSTCFSLLPVEQRQRERKGGPKIKEKSGKKMKPFFLAGERLQEGVSLPIPVCKIRFLIHLQ